MTVWKSDNYLPQAIPPTPTVSALRPKSHDCGTILPRHRGQHFWGSGRQKRLPDGILGQLGHRQLGWSEGLVWESCSWLHSTLPFYRAPPSSGRNRNSMVGPCTSHDVYRLRHFVKRKRLCISREQKDHSNADQERRRFHLVDDRNQLDVAEELGQILGKVAGFPSTHCLGSKRWLRSGPRYQGLDRTQRDPRGKGRHLEVLWRRKAMKEGRGSLSVRRADSPEMVELA